MISSWKTRKEKKRKEKK